RLTTLACCLVATALSAQTAPVKTDFNGDGKSDILWQKTTTSATVEQQMFNSSILAQGAVHTPQNSNWVVVAAADANGDGKADLFWQNRLTGDVYLMYMDGLSPVFTATASIPASKKIYSEPNPDWQIVLAADLNQDGVTDLLWHNKADGRVFSMYLDATGAVKSTSAVIYTEKALDWAPVAFGNFSKVTNGTDIVWYNHASGAVYLMPLGADGKPTAAGKIIYTEANTAWKLVAAADFNNDGNVDLLWWNNTTGQVYLLLLDSSFAKISTDAGKGVSGVIYTEKVVTGFVPVAVGDYNGDGYTDILWRNQVTGQVYMMFMDSAHPGKVNATDSAIVYTEADTTWRPVAGLSTVNITPPVADPLAATLFTGESAIAPFVPMVTLTKNDPITFSAGVRGPVSDANLAWEVWNAAATAKITDAAVASVTSGGAFSAASTAQNFLLKAVSSADATKVSSRLIKVVPAAAITSFTVDKSSVAQGSPVTFGFGLTGNSTAVLTTDSDVNFSQSVFGQTSATITPSASGTWTLTAKNVTGKAASATVVVAVDSTNTALDVAITTNTAGVVGNVTNVSIGNVYTASVKAETGVTYAWTITKGAGGSAAQSAVISGGQGTNQITYNPTGTAGDTLVISITKTDAKGNSNTGTKTITLVKAPTVVKSLSMNQATIASGKNFDKYVTVGKPITVTAMDGASTPAAITGNTNVWTVTPASAGVITAQNDAAGTVTISPTGTGTINIAVVAKNAAGATLTSYAENRTIIADPTAATYLITPAGTGFVTPNVASNGGASVPDAGGAVATYAWTLGFTGSAAATIDTGTDTARVMTYTATAGAASNTVTFSCAVTNANNLTGTISNMAATGGGVTVALQTLAAAPAKPSAITFTAPAGNVTMGKNSTASVTSTSAGLVNTAGYKTYHWVITNATFVSGQDTNTGVITYTPTAAGPVTFSVTEVNAAGVASAAQTDTTTIAGVAAPAFTTPLAATSLLSAGDSCFVTYAFTGGTGTLINTTGTGVTAKSNVTGLSSNTTSVVYGTGTSTATTTYTNSTLNANDPAAKQTLTLLVTNAAGDTASQTVTVDVAALADNTNTFLNPFTNVLLSAPYDGTAKDYGTSLWL
ncbi:MAG: FG-GAP-like repeat-containing protein, partial [Verrucomicrobiota bacterium]